MSLKIAQKCLIINGTSHILLEQYQDSLLADMRHTFLLSKIKFAYQVYEFWFSVHNTMR
jgi:hypothetical protein